MKNIVLFVVFVVSWINSFAQQTILLPSGTVTEGILNVMPYRDVVQKDDGFEVTYTFGGVIKIKNIENDGTDYIKIPGFGLNHEEGIPCIPMRWDSFVISDSVNYSVEIVDSNYIETNVTLPAACELDIISGNNNPKTNVAPVRLYKGYYPQTLVNSVHVQQYGDVPILNVRVCPLQYNLTHDRARLYSKITYKVKYNRDDAKDRLLISDNISRTNMSYLYNTTLNYPILCESKNSKHLLGNEPDRGIDRQDFLIVSVTEYSEAVNRFANWKKTLGFTPHIVLKDRGQWDSSDVYAVAQYAKSVYSNLSFLLVIGDYQDVPADNMGAYVTDYLFLNSANNISPISNGRLPVSNPSEAITVVDKIINYERTPVVDSLFYKNALVCAFFQDGDSINDPRRSNPNVCQYDMRRFAKTAEEVRSHLVLQGKNVSRVYYAYPGATPKYWNNGYYSNGEEIPVEIQKPYFLWDGSWGDINNNISAGTFCVVFNDHGGPMCWRDPWYHSVHLDYLHNYDKLPVIFSMCCETGCFNDTTCFAEKFLRKDDGGCVAIFAATGEGYSGYNDALTEGMIDAIWPNPGLIPQFPNHSQNVTPTPDPTYCLGHILKQGLKRMEETWGSSMVMREIYHCFGDPSMKITTKAPTPFSNATITRTENSINVQTGEGIARISFFDQRTDSVISFVGASADYYGNSDAVTVCISAHNKIPLVDERNLLYIQNTSFGGTNELESDVIIAGRNVTNHVAPGEVRFENGRTMLRGNVVEFHGGTVVNNGAEIVIDKKP